MGALSQEGSDLALQSLPDGRVDVVWGTDGNPVFDDTQEWRVTGLLLSRLGEWWADPTGKRGSRLHQVKQDKRGLTKSQLESYAKEALRVAEEGKFIKLLLIQASRLGNSRYRLLVRWTTGAGKPPIERRYEFQG